MIRLANPAQRFWPFLLLATVVIAAYAGLSSIGFVWDDPYITQKNPFFTSWAGIAKLVTSDVFSATAVEEFSHFYRPLGMLSFALDRNILGNSALGYHFSSLFVHLLSVCLLFALLKKLDGSVSQIRPLVVALLFGVAPIAVETVAWISCRFDLLGVALSLGALLLARSTRASATVVSGLLAGLSLFCKESFIVTPFFVIAYEVYVLRQRPAVLRTATMFVLVVFYFVLRRVAGVGTSSAVESLTTVDFVRSFAFLLTTYAQCLMIPTYLDGSRPYAPVELLPALAIIALAIAIAVSLGALAVRRLPASNARVVIFGLVWFFVSLAPPVVVGPTVGMVGERYAYFPILGLFFALGAMLAKMSSRWPVALASVAVMASAARTHERIPDLRDDHTLFTAASRQHPSNDFAWYMLGELDAVAGNLEAAERSLSRALELRPASWRAEVTLCYVYLNQQRLDEALPLCLQSARRNSSNPRVWTNLAAIFFRQQRFDACVDAADHGIEVKPHNVESSYLRAGCLANLGRIDEAVRELNRTLELAPTHPGANGLADQFRARGIDLFGR